MINKIAGILKKRFDHNETPVIISIGGPGGSGKSTFAVQLSAALNSAPVLKLDNYRKSRKERAGTGLLGSNPEANYIDLLVENLKSLKDSKDFCYPVYDEVTGEIKTTRHFKPGKFNIIDGELVLHDKVIKNADFIIIINRALFPLFIDRLKRDRNSRSYSLIKSIKVFIESNLIEYNKYYRRNLSKADIIIIRKSNGYKIMKGMGGV